MRPCPPRRLTAEVWAPVPFPGHPLGIAADGGTLYAGTHRQVTGEPNVPSHVYTYNRRGEITADYVIEGQAEEGQGICGIALDHDGVLYIVDQAPARVITLDPRTGVQGVYAEIPDAPVCDESPGDESAGEEPAGGGCSDAGTDRPAQPINAVFGPDGYLYVGDLTQAAIWRIPPGGGTAELWYTDDDLDSLFGANTLHFTDWGGRRLLFSDSAHRLMDPADLPTARGRLYTLEIREDGSPGRRELFWEAGADGETPDGFAVGRSGNVYVALAVANSLLVLGPDGREITRVPATAEENGERDVPFDLPGGVAVFRDRVMVTNQVFLTDGPAAHEVLFALDVHEPGEVLFRPRIPRAGAGEQQLVLSGASVR